MIQAGLYLRMSRDAEARGLGIGRQRKDGEALASRPIWLWERGVSCQQEPGDAAIIETRE